ncbi:MAG: agmatine deiminase family protein, partial [Flavobacteriales bacterium]|nr:agmatine deiminase family protein [Flavobacteriales bacterium]
MLTEAAPADLTGNVNQKSHLMKYIATLSVFLFAMMLHGQDLPATMTPRELELMIQGHFNLDSDRGIEDPPPFENLRAMAEWEEIQALTIAWTSYPCILKQIVAIAKEETLVIILSEDVTETEDYLTSSSCGGALTLDNVTIVDANFDSVWMRDYAANPVYGNEVEDLILVDWIYNRPNRPNDNASPSYFADLLGIDLYCLTEAPTDLVNTGGNFMTDGFGTAFASKLILDENEVGNNYDVTPKTEEEIDAIMLDWLGLDQYIKMETLPYDEIHHIDMHMKLIDEETIIVGQFPEDVADGPQIEANIDYVLSNFNSKFGTPYKVIWLPMPPSTSGDYVDDGAAYRTYTNCVFVNNSIIVPYYRPEYDTVAYNILSNALPGYNIVGIDCDNNFEPIIFASGAIHCITHAIGVEDPLLISHQPLPDTDDTVNPYEAIAYINHRDGIANATLWWKTDLADEYQSLPMTDQGSNNWSALIPAQPGGTIVYYYIHAAANTGKEQTRPMPAPDGYWKFIVGDMPINVASAEPTLSFHRVFPNPAGAITCVDLQSKREETATVTLFDSYGKQVQVIFKGTLKQGQNKF